MYDKKCKEHIKSGNQGNKADNQELMNSGKNAVPFLIF